MRLLSPAQTGSPMPLSIHFAEHMYRLWGRLAACGGLPGRPVLEQQSDSMSEQRVQGDPRGRGIGVKIRIDLQSGFPLS
jgi:hypothetical protein